MPNRITAPMPAAWSSVASATSSEIERRSTPGIDGTSSRTPSPATTNSGCTRCWARELGLAHQIAQRLRAPHASHAGGGKAHRAILGRRQLAGQCNPVPETGTGLRRPGVTDLPSPLRLGIPGPALRRTGEGRAAPARRRRRPGSPGGGSACPAPGRAASSAPDIASSAASNGNSARTTLITSNRAGLTVPDSTSEMNAIGSEIMNASSELARTSRAAAPIAAPKAANAAPPATIATQDEREAAPVDVDEQRQAGEHQEGDDDRQRHAQAHLLDRAAPTSRTSPRVSRAKAFSSRSSASEPATSSTVTNIRVTVAATEIANESRLGGEPETTSFWTSIGCAIDESSGVGEVEVLARQPRELDHPLQRAGERAVLRQLRLDRLEDALGVLEPEDVERLAEQVEAAAPQQQGQVVRGEIGSPSSRSSGSPG